MYYFENNSKMVGERDPERVQMLFFFVYYFTEKDDNFYH